MISVVMPTMWRSDRTQGLLDSLNESDLVSEIVLIDNDVKSRPEITFGPKVRVLEQKKNIFVNPAWNLGVKETSEDVICIINDDITIDCKRYFPFFIECFKEYDCLGLSKDCYNYAQEDDVFVKDGQEIGGGWGCLMMLKREIWKDIPSKLKIWFGDNLIAKNATKCGSMLLPVQTEMSTTSESPDMHPQIRKDIAEWEKMGL